MQRRRWKRCVVSYWTPKR
jgi:hypothetical protein